MCTLIFYIYIIVLAMLEFTNVTCSIKSPILQIKIIIVFVAADHLWIRLWSVYLYA